MDEIETTHYIAQMDYMLNLVYANHIRTKIMEIANSDNAKTYHTCLNMTEALDVSNNSKSYYLHSDLMQDLHMYFE